jgi:hypothetical protein
LKHYLFIFIYIFSSTVYAGLTPDKRKELFQAANQRLKDAKLESKVPKVGDTFPDLKIQDKSVSDF